MSISVYDLLEAGAHFGHQIRYRNPKMESYIFSIRNKVTVIDLEKTYSELEKAAKLLGSIAAKRGKVLFVGTKFAAKDAIKNAASRCKMPYVSERWLGGMLTNYKTIRHSIRKLKQLETQFENEAFGELTKKEILELSRLKEKLEKNLGGIKNMGGLPDILFVIDTGKEHIAIQEAKKLKIPVIGIVDTNNDPDVVDFVIPGNDDAVKAIQLYLDTIVEAIVSEQAKLPADLEEELKKSKRTHKKAQARAEAAKKVVVREKSEAVKETVEKKAEPKKSEKPATKKVAEKKTEAKKAPAKKATAEKKPAAKKAPAKKAATAKKPAAKKAE